MLKTLFSKIPFLNGGLFECLDSSNSDIIIDGFRTAKKHHPIVPNFLFFSDTQKVDISRFFGKSKKDSRLLIAGLFARMEKLNTKSFHLTIFEFVGERMDDFSAKWCKKYRFIKNKCAGPRKWNYFNYLKFSSHIQSMIYTTNWIES